MKQRTVVAWALCLALALTIAACSENSTGTGNNTMTGDLVGNILLTGKDFRKKTDHSGVTVLVEGTDFSTVTDVNGDYRLEGLPSGTYVITYSKPGFGTYKVFGYQFVGDGTAYMEQLSLAEKITYVIDNVSVLVDTEDSTSGVWFEAELREPDGTPLLYDVELKVWLGPTSTLGPEAVHTFFMDRYESSKDGEEVYVDDPTPEIRNGKRILRRFIRRSLLNARNLKSGSTAYATAYARSVVIQYYDPESKQTVNSGMVDVQSDVVAFKVP